MVVNPKDNFIDVICQYTRDGKIIPMRIRIQNDEGLYQTYNIKGYKELTHSGNYTTPYGTKGHSLNWSFLCQIQVFDRMMNVELFFNGRDNLWKISNSNFQN